MSSVSASRRWYSLGGDVGGPSPTFHPSEPDAMTELDHVDYRLPTTVVPSRYDLRLEPDLRQGDVQRRGNRHRSRSGSPSRRSCSTRWSSGSSPPLMEDASGALVEGSVALDEPAERARILFPAPIAPGPWRLRLRLHGHSQRPPPRVLPQQLQGRRRGRPHDGRHPVRGDRRAAGVPVLGRAGVRKPSSA